MDNNASNASVGVRLRFAERNRMQWKPQCLDELLGADHPAGAIWAVVCGLDLSRFHEPIGARAGTSDLDATRMKMGNGGYSPAFNGQLVVDTQSRAMVGVGVSNEGNDYDLSGPMRRQVQERTGIKAAGHLMDGGYTKIEHVESAAADGVAVYAPPKPVRNKDKRPDEFTPLPGDSAAVKQRRQRMGSEAGKEIYKQRASTSETETL